MVPLAFRGISGGTRTAQKCPVLLGLLQVCSLVAALPQEGDRTRIELDGKQERQKRWHDWQGRLPSSPEVAVEYAPHKIRVNAIAPSVTLTDRVKRLLAANQNVSKLASSHLLGLGQPIHVANMAVYLASDESEITTGQILSVDSGVTIY